MNTHSEASVLIIHVHIHNVILQVVGVHDDGCIYVCMYVWHACRIARPDVLSCCIS